MTKPEEVLRKVVRALESAGIPYMLTGSFAGSFHGAPRATQDLDIVIAPSGAQLEALVAALPPDDYYVDLDAAREALAGEGQFNVVDLSAGWKIDLIVRKSRPFNLAEFERRTTLDALGLRLSVVSAEDLIIVKLEWAKLGESSRQLEDVVAILRVRWDQLDRAYIQQWTDRLGLLEEWCEACRRAGVGE